MKLKIERLGHLGDAIAPGPEGGMILTGPFLPGEVVEGELRENRLQGARIVTPSADRIRPPCSHARACGGCLLQHASDEFVAGWKMENLRSALAGQGIEAPILPILTSPPRSRRRATLTGRRTKSGVLIGFHARASGTLVAISDCHLLDPGLMGVFPALEALIREGGTRKAELSLTVTRSLSGPDVAVKGGKPLDPQLRMTLAALTESHGLARLAWDGEVIAQHTPPVQAMGAARVVPPPGSFLQATDHGEAALLASVREAVGNARRITDLFAGVGTFALPLAERAEITAYEGDAAMIAALDRAWRQAEGLKRVTAMTRDLFRRPLEPDEFKGIDAVVIDPPRAGAEAQTRALALARVPVVAAVSCNPVTFARDARILTEAGYGLDWVQPVDQFRWSTHVELAARFRLVNMDRA
ncbi:MAG: class I SAM-dependent RNA methyltransferase [Pseudorhodobacter sp.]